MVLNKKGIIKEFELVVYPYHIVAVLGDMEEEVNKLYKPLDEGYDVIGKPKEGADATTYHVRNKESSICSELIWFCDEKSICNSNITHESNHAALDIFAFIGAELNYNDQEPFCYLSGAISRLISGTYKEYLDSKRPKTTKKK